MTDDMIRSLAGVLIDCVEGGASVSFMHPLEQGKAEAFWRRVGGAVAGGASHLYIAEDAGGIVGTVVLVLSLPENQPHRADVAKLLVRRRVRRRGVGAALMRAVEDGARTAGRTLLVLDTATGGDAERLYARLGWTLAGVIPEYALWPHGGLTGASFYYKKLA